MGASLGIGIGIGERKERCFGDSETATATVSGE